MNVIRSLYIEILQRPADPEGLRVYTDLLACTSIEHVTSVLRASDEHAILHMDVKISEQSPDIPSIDTGEKYHACQIVVSMYEEDISWVKECNVHTVVYNKGPFRNGTTTLENIGREGGTYLHHIIHNYDALRDYTVFTQGDPFAHNPQFMKDVHAPMSAFQSLGMWWSPDVPPANVRDMCPVPHIHIGNHDFVCYHPIVWKDHGWMHIAKRIKVRHSIIDVLHFVCERLRINTPSTGIPISMCGMFGVHKSRIHWYPRSFYENMLTFLYEHPDHGYIIERMWAFLFLVRRGEATKRK
jgi:hypothetical protein